MFKSGPGKKFLKFITCLVTMIVQYLLKPDSKKKSSFKKYLVFFSSFIQSQDTPFLELRGWAKD
jgi:hypothetical protein